MHLVVVKKFDKCLFIGWSVAVFILLANIFNYTFNLLINNIVREPITDESLFYVFYFFIKYSFAWDIRLIIAFLYQKRHLLLKLRVQEMLLVSF